MNDGIIKRIDPQQRSLDVLYKIFTTRMGIVIIRTVKRETPSMLLSQPAHLGRDQVIKLLHA